MSNRLKFIQMMKLDNRFKSIVNSNWVWICCCRSQREREHMNGKGNFKTYPNPHKSPSFIYHMAYKSA